MRVKAIKNNSGSFPKKYFDAGYTSQGKFDLELGKEYTVYGINVWSDYVSYLIIPEQSERPSWYPDQLFEITENRMPPDWCVAVFPNGEKNDLQLIVGYDEIVNSLDSHYDALIERDPEALAIFNERKSEIDSLEEL